MSAFLCIEALDHRDAAVFRQVLGQIVQPIVAGGQDQPLGALLPQGGLVDLQLHGIQDGLLAHGLHNAAGAQDGKPAFHPDVGVKGAFGGFLAPLDIVMCVDERKFMLPMIYINYRALGISMHMYLVRMFQNVPRSEEQCTKYKEQYTKNKPEAV